MARQSNPSRTSVILGLLIGVFAASTAAVFIRFAQAGGAPSLVIASARLTLASLILAPFTLARYRNELRELNGKSWLLAGLSGVFLALHFVSWITSLEYTSVASSVVFVSTTPLWVALTAPLLLHEHLGRIAIIGLVLALIGGIFISLSDTCTWQNGILHCSTFKEIFTEKAFRGDILAMGGAWMAAGYLIVGRKLRVSLSLLPYIFIVYGMAALVLIVITLSLGKSPLGLPPLVYLWFILLAVIPQLIGHSIFNWSLKYLPASFISVSLLGEPIGSAIFAFFIFQEIPGWVKIGGALLLLAGIYLVGKSEIKQA